MPKLRRIKLLKLAQALAFKNQLTPMENNCCKCPSTTKEVCGYLDSEGKFFHTKSEANDSDIARKIYNEMCTAGYQYSPSMTDVKKIINKYVALKPLYND